MESLNSKTLHTHLTKVHNFTQYGPTHCVNIFKIDQQINQDLTQKITQTTNIPLFQHPR